MEKKYGKLPQPLGIFRVECNEMMFYQYLPIKMAGSMDLFHEDRLWCFFQLMSVCALDYHELVGTESYKNSYMYLTAKRMYQAPKCSFNRLGWHSDGFMTDDINYIWCDAYPTIFNDSDFNLTLDDSISLKEMEQQAKRKGNVFALENNLYRLDQYTIHKVQNVIVGGMRTFVKISFSKDKYDLIGNSHNYEIDYKWEMKERKQERNIPQTIITTNHIK